MRAAGNPNRGRFRRPHVGDVAQTQHHHFLYRSKVRFLANVKNRTSFKISKAFKHLRRISRIVLKANRRHFKNRVLEPNHRILEPNHRIFKFWNQITAFVVHFNQKRSDSTLLSKWFWNQITAFWTEITAYPKIGLFRSQNPKISAGRNFQPEKGRKIPNPNEIFV